jgi:hypothetical protein
LVLVIKFQNWISLTTQLAKPFKFDHRAVFMDGFTDVNATWWWSSHVSTISLLDLSFSSLVGGKKWLGIKIISN